VLQADARACATNGRLRRLRVTSFHLLRVRYDMRPRSDEENLGRRDALTPEGRPGPRLRTFTALRHRNYQLFFAGQLISLCGTWMQQMALSWLVYDLTHSAFLLGTIGAIGSLPTALFALLGGAVADRVNKRRLLVATQSVAMTLAFVLTVLTATGWVRVWHVGVLAALGGLNMAFDMPTRQAFVVEMVGREDLMNAIALNSSIFNSARIVGPAIAGVLVAKLGPAWCFFANGLSFLAVIGGLLAMQFEPRGEARRSRGVVADTAEGLRYVRSNQRVLGLAALLALVSVFGWSYGVLMPVFARDILHRGAQGLGYLMTANGVGALVGALLVASLGSYPYRERVLFGGGILLSLAAASFALSRSLHLSLFILAFAGLGGVALMSVANTLLQTSVPDHMRGRVMGVWALVFAGSTPIGSFQAGALAQYLTAPTAVLIGAGATFTGVMVAMLAWWRRRAGRAGEREGGTANGL
jgi:MFS family permease